MTFHPDSLPDLTGKVYIVTGGTSGIGYHTVTRLAQHGAHVYMCCRSASKGIAAINRISSLPYLLQSSSQPKPINITPLEMDHLSLSTVISATHLFLSRETALHGLINNAGIMATPFEMSKDGYEAQWQTNYLAHWVFTEQLLPLMRSTSKDKTLPRGSVRIVNLSSSGHYSAPKGGINFADTALPEASGMARYGQSKLANVLHMRTLHKLYGPGSESANAGAGEIWCTAVHPGLVESNLGTKAELPWMVRLVIAPYKAMGGMVGADRGCWTSLYCVASDEMGEGGSGRYFQRVADENGWLSGMAKDVGGGLGERLDEWTTEEMRKGGWVGE